MHVEHCAPGGLRAAVHHEGRDVLTARARANGKGTEWQGQRVETITEHVTFHAAQYQRRPGGKRV
ncbi:hypothetical protein GCM10010174_63010 [Kutzneria viridogrisea]